MGRKCEGGGPVKKAGTEGTSWGVSGKKKGGSARY